MDTCHKVNLIYVKYNMSHATICLLQLVLRNNAKSSSMCHVQLDINCVH